ncbi:MAG: hypothetical protein K0R78_3209 [Pelosinus sp.]|jgi:hypothetical protein|nr:hypothetical protein [Pelosinus sp.]
MQQTNKLGLNKIELTDSPPDITTINPNWDTIDAELDAARKIQTAGGTGTAITLTIPSLVDNLLRTFIVAANNGSAATTINGKPLYKPGTTTAPNLIAGKAVTVWYNATSSCFFIKASAEGNASPGDVLATKTFSSDNDTGITGTMPNRGAVTITPGTANQAITAGYHNGSGYVAGDPDLISANIKAGSNIFNIAGKTEVVDTTEATNPIAAASVLSGKVGFVNGAKVTGSIASKAAQTYTPGTTDQTIAANQYLSGIQTIVGDADLVTGNIKAGATIFNVAGKTEVVDTTEATNPIAAASVLSGKVGFVNGAKVTGNIVDHSLTNQALADIDVDGIAAVGRLYVRPPKGYYGYGNTWLYKEDPDFIAANFRADKNFFGLQGAMPIKKGITGATSEIEAKSVQRSSNGYAYMEIDPNQYYDGVSWVRNAQPNLIPTNITNGINIFGVVGNSTKVLSGIATISTGTWSFKSSGSIKDYAAGINACYYINVSGLTFKPTKIVAFLATPSSYKHVRNTVIYQANTTTPGESTIFCAFDTFYYYDTDAAVANTYAAYVNSTGFVLPVGNSPNLAGGTVIWFAIQ